MTVGRLAHKPRCEVTQARLLRVGGTDVCRGCACVCGSAWRWAPSLRSPASSARSLGLAAAPRRTHRACDPRWYAALPNALRDVARFALGCGAAASSWSARGVRATGIPPPRRCGSRASSRCRDASEACPTRMIRVCEHARRRVVAGRDRLDRAADPQPVPALARRPRGPVTRRPRARRRRKEAKDGARRRRTAAGPTASTAPAAAISTTSSAVVLLVIVAVVLLFFLVVWVAPVLWAILAVLLEFFFVTIAAVAILVWRVVLRRPWRVVAPARGGRRGRAAWSQEIVGYRPSRRRVRRGRRRSRAGPVARRPRAGLSNWRVNRTPRVRFTHQNRLRDPRSGSRRARDRRSRRVARSRPSARSRRPGS